jgi:hypothetical protein
MAPRAAENPVHFKNIQLRYKINAVFALQYEPKHQPPFRIIYFLFPFLISYSLFFIFTPCFPP